MPLFNYKAVNKLGKKIAGSLYANNKEEASASLKKSELNILKLATQPDKEPFWKKAYGTVSFKEKIIFLKYMTTILQSGLTIKKALELLSSQMKGKYFGKILGTIRDGIEHGQSFSESLKKYPKIFSAAFVNMIAVGEVSGTLPSVLKYLDDLLSKEYALNKQIKGAMAYPLVILSLVIVVVIGLVKFIIPRIISVFANFDIKLPLPTRMIIAAEHILSTYWAVMLISVAVFIFTIVMLLKIRKVRKGYHIFLLHTPLFGSLIKQIQITRFTQVTSSLLSSGLTIVEALGITAKTLKNLVYMDYIIASAKYIESGGELAAYLDQRPDLFEPIVTQMIKLGESTGSLDDTLKVLAELNELEVSEKIKNLSNLIGPMMLILMGVLVGGIAVSIIMPIYQLPSLLQQGR